MEAPYREAPELSSIVIPDRGPGSGRILPCSPQGSSGQAGPPPVTPTLAFPSIPDASLCHVKTLVYRQRKTQHTILGRRITAANRRLAARFGRLWWDPIDAPCVILWMLGIAVIGRCGTISYGRGNALLCGVQLRIQLVFNMSEAGLSFEAFFIGCWSTIRWGLCISQRLDSPFVAISCTCNHIAKL
jgi:hypothetical protein